MNNLRCVILVCCCFLNSWMFAGQDNIPKPTVDHIGLGGSISKGLLGMSSFNQASGTYGDFIIELESGYNPHITMVQQFAFGYSYQRTGNYEDGDFVHTLDTSYALMGRFYMGDYVFFQLGFDIGIYIPLGKRFINLLSDSPPSKYDYNRFVVSLSPMIGFGGRVPVDKKSDISFALGLKLDGSIMFGLDSYILLSATVIYHFSD